jgi:hypothetical protein
MNAAFFDRIASVLGVSSLGGLADPAQLTRQGALLDHYNFG